MTTSNSSVKSIRRVTVSELRTSSHCRTAASTRGSATISCGAGGNALNALMAKVARSSPRVPNGWRVGA